MAKYQVIIGRAEEVDIVGTVLDVPAKIDTGAFRSSIHATNIREATVDGKKVLKFAILGHRCAPVKYDITTERYENIVVRSSNGEESDRYEVSLKIKIGPKIFMASFSLYDRSNNVFPILIGREALKYRFLVDAAKTSVARMKLSKEFGLELDSPEDFED